MALVFRLPAVGDTMVEAEIVEWLVSVGEQVDLDQAVCSIETDKSVVEMTSPYRGTVLQLGGRAGDTIAVGEPLIVIGQAGEKPGEERRAPAASPAPTARDTEPQHAAPPPMGEAGRVRAMPKVRKLARKRSIDLATIVGTGPGGSVTAADVEAAASAGGGDRELLTPLRRTLARHLTESVRQIPQFTAMVEADGAAVLAARSALAARTGAPAPLDAVLMFLLAPLLRDHPVMNAALDSDAIVYHDRCDIGVAVDTSAGLMTPVVRGADRRSATELSAEILRLTDAARARTLKPNELTGATATLNNVGAVGIIAGTPILPLGTSMIAAFGRARPAVRLRGGVPTEVPMITICATFDHRMIDGGAAGRFLTRLSRRIESPPGQMLT